MNETVAAWIAALNWFDWVLVVVISISTLYGLFRGFIKEAVTVTAWMLAAWLSYAYADDLAIHLDGYIETASMRVALMVLAVFVVVLSGSSLLRKGGHWLINQVGLMGLDYVLGGIFGCIRGMVVSLLIMVGLLNLGFSSDHWWQSSYLVEHFNVILDQIPDHLPQDVKVVYKRIAMR